MPKCTIGGVSSYPKVNNSLTMETQDIRNTYKMVCETPSGSGFFIDHMPDFLYKGEIDDGIPHVHTFYEILWFQDGTGSHFVDFQEYPIHPGTIFFLTPGQVHNFDGSDAYKGVAIKLCTDFMQGRGDDSDLFVKYDLFHTFDTSPYYVIDDGTAAQLQALVDSMEEELKIGKDVGHIDMLRSLLKIFLIKVHRYGYKEGELRLDGLKPAHRLFVQFRGMLEKDYATKHTVQEYADGLNVSVRTLNKCVNECSGRSPLAFITDRIMLEARRQVRYGNLMIKEIAYNLGYEDPSYFVKLFKRQTGMLPSDFREMDEVSHCSVR
ncbi:MAG: AraC family transcriptional regulator [Bacteroidaceae bacterium]|nr:AraC family transcriptional regulator [Bacteroidaceae bacterium]